MRRRAETAPPPPSPAPTPVLGGVVDAPTPYAEVPAGTVEVRGWTTCDGAPPLAVAALIDGEAVASAAAGSEPRPDVAKALGDERLAAAGWRMAVDLGGCPPGQEVRLDIVAWATPTGLAQPVASLPLVVGGPSPAVEEEDPPVEFDGRLDLPAAGIAIRGRWVRVSGWVVHPDGPVRRIDITVDGRPAGAARVGLSRPDIAALRPEPDAAISGFEHTVDLGEADGDQVTIHVVARVAGHPPTVVAGGTWLREADDPGGPVTVRPGPGAQHGSDRLDLVVITHDLGLGGAQLWLDELLDRTRAGTDFRCTVVSTRGGPLRARLEARGIAVRVTQGFPFDDPEAYDGRMTELALLLADGGHDVALVNTFGSHLGTGAALRAGLPTVWAIHESHAPGEFWHAAYPPPGLHPDIAASALQSLAACQAVTFVAEATRQLFAGHLDPERSAVVRYGIDLEKIARYCAGTSRNEARRQLGLPDGATIVLMVGTIEERKAQSRVALAMAELSDRHPGLMCIQVGDAPTWYSAGLHDYVARAGLEATVLTVPLVEDPSPWFRAADVFLCASDIESMPRSILEAMAFSLPVVATNVFGNPELIDHGRSGFLFEPKDLDACVGELDRVLAGGRERWEAVGRAGLQRVRVAGDGADYAAAMLALLDGVAADPDAVPADLLRPAGSLETAG